MAKVILLEIFCIKFNKSRFITVKKSKTRLRNSTQISEDTVKQKHKKFQKRNIKLYVIEVK